MTVPSTIRGEDSRTLKPVTIHGEVKHGRAGMVVYTEPLLDKSVAIKPAFNDEYGVNMAVDPGLGGTPVVIHNGTDSVAWTGSSIQGNKVTFDSTDRAQAGTKAVKVDNPGNNDVWQFAKGSDIDLSNYATITMHINVDNDWEAGDSISFFGYDTGAGVIVGNAVLLEDYFSFNEFDLWHKVVIPLADLGLEASTIDSVRMQLLAKEGKAPKFYIDTFQVEEQGVPIVFTIAADLGTIFHLEKLHISYLDADTSVVGDRTGISYNKILNVSKLANGITTRRVERDVTLFQNTITCIWDHLRVGAKLVDTISDGTNAGVTIETDFGTTPLKLHGSKRDRIEISVRDDLSGLLDFRAVAIGYEVDDRAAVENP